MTIYVNLEGLITSLEKLKSGENIGINTPQAIYLLAMEIQQIKTYINYINLEKKELL